ncbi:MAG: TolC family protein [Candidatus Sumerlaeia bacterium]|nr:TolC family protein [Candidatus Sumerlaeia bacterium]
MHRPAAALAALAIAAAGCLPPPPTTTYAALRADEDYAAASELASQRPLDLETLWRMADLANHELVAARFEREAVRGDWRQARLWPNPSASAMRDKVPLDNLDGGDGEIVATLGQPVPLGGRIGAATRLEQARHQLAAARAEAVRRRVLLAVHQAYLDLLHEQKRQPLFESLLERADELAAAAGERGAPEDEVARISVEVGEFELDITRAVASQVFAGIKLAELVGELPIETGALGGELSDGIRARPEFLAAERQVALHPELAAAALELDAAEREVELRRQEAVPDATVFALLRRDDTMDETTGGVGVSVPIPIFDRNQGRIEAARTRAEAAAHRVSGAKTRLRRELEQAVLLETELDTLAWDYGSRLLPEAAAARASAFDRYRAGTGTLNDALDTLQREREVAEAALRYRYELSVQQAIIDAFADRYGPPPEP